MTLDALLAEIRGCRLCRDEPRHGLPLPHEPRPVLRVAAGARLVIAGQAPGVRVHASGTPFTDPSGARLRQWLGLDEQQFYDPRRVAIVPMGFCFPGHDRSGGDLPPRRECALTWHERLFEAMPRPELVVAIGRTAHVWHLRRWNRGAFLAPTVDATILNWRAILDAAGAPRVVVLPHPSWRNNAWLAARPWFEAELLPALRDEVAHCMSLGG